MRAIFILPFVLIIFVALLGYAANLPGFYGPKDRELVYFSILAGFFIIVVVALWHSR